VPTRPVLWGLDPLWRSLPAIERPPRVSLLAQVTANDLDFQEFLVASVCDVCGKGPGFGMSVSHSHRRTPRRWNPNIQTVHALVGKTPKRLNVCTSCLKAGKVTRA
jgi:large subunit ribosomal protein L28